MEAQPPLHTNYPEDTPALSATTAAANSSSDRIAALEATTRELRNEVADARAQLEAFGKQFE